MASTDWTSALTTGVASFAIVADGTAPSGPDVMEINVANPSGLAFQNVTGGTFKDSAMSGWVNQPQSNGSANLFLCLRSLDDTTFIANPASYFYARCSAVSTTGVRLQLGAVVAGVVTTILDADVSSVNGDPINTWQQFRFSALNSGTDVLLRIEQWDGAAFVPIADAAAPIASFPTLDAAGGGRFGIRATVAAIIRVDDVDFSSIA